MKHGPKTIIYIDGFNLYYGAIRQGRGIKWLDLNRWLNKLFPNNDIVKIKFFTARVTGKHDPQKPIRQSLYLRALATLPNVEVIEGKFFKKPIKIQVTQDVVVLGISFEEKGTDVNIAAHMLHDAHLGKFEVGVIVSNDSDLSGVVKMVTQDIGLDVGIVNPCIGKNFTKMLIEHASFKEEARIGPIRDSQFSETLTDAAGVFIKPESW